MKIDKILKTSIKYRKALIESACEIFRNNFTSGGRYLIIQTTVPISYEYIITELIINREIKLSIVSGNRVLKSIRLSSLSTLELESIIFGNIKFL